MSEATEIRNRHGATLASNATIKASAVLSNNIPPIEDIEIPESKSSHENDPDSIPNSIDSNEKVNKSKTDVSNEKEPKSLPEESKDSSSKDLTPIPSFISSFSNSHYLNVAPLDTPLQSRLETFAVLWFTISIPVFVCLSLFILSWGIPSWIFVVVPYMIWWYGFDLHTPTNGKVVYRTRNWMKNLIIWEWFVNYFPIKVHKTCELTPTFTDVEYLDEEEDHEHDELDLISEISLTNIDKIFRLLGLKKRLNQPTPPIETVKDDDSITSSTSLKKVKIKRVTTGPRYIFGYHPHGVISMGAVGTFATNAVRNEPFKPPFKFLQPLFHDPSKGKQLLPGIGHIYPLTLTTQFTLPIYRDYILSLGVTSASGKNIKSLINNGDNSCCVVIGGAKESLMNNIVSATKVGRGYKGKEITADPVSDSEDEETSSRQSSPTSESNSIKSATHKKQCKIVLHNRKGFVRLAIELGNVSLVPTFAFGEIDIYKLNIPKKDTWGYHFQQWMKKNFGFTIPFFSARGIFIYDFGFLPYRNPINICLGKPVHIPEGTLADYKAKHPELDHEDEKEPIKVPETQQDKLKTKEIGGIMRTESLTSLFKLSSKPKKKSIKTKIPTELLDHYHQLYIQELKNVYEANKDKYGYGDVELVIC